MHLNSSYLEEGELEPDELKDEMIVRNISNKENLSNDRSSPSFSPKKRKISKNEEDFEKKSENTQGKRKPIRDISQKSNGIGKNSIHENGKTLKKIQNYENSSLTPSIKSEIKDPKQPLSFGRSTSVDDLNSFFPDWVDPGGELIQNPFEELTAEIRRKKKAEKLEKQQKEKEILNKITTIVVEDPSVNTIHLKKRQALYCGDGWIRDKNGELKVAVSWKFSNEEKPIDPRIPAELST